MYNRVRDSIFYSSLLCLPALTHAQNRPSGNDPDLFLNFAPGSGDSACTAANSSAAIGFIAAGTPLLSHCFNLAELFSGNTTNGFVNQTENLGTGVHWLDSEPGILWSLSNADSYDASTNYSTVHYRQHYPVNAPDAQPGDYAALQLSVYPSPDCSSIVPDTERGLSYYGFNCWSEVEGSCGTMSYSAASIRVGPGRDEDEQHGKCWVFAQEGAASGVIKPFQSAVSALVGLTLAVWLAT